MIPLLPKWHLHGNRPTFYDGDAVTMLELASTLHGTMNTVIEEYNKLADQVNETITEFMQATEKDQEVFATAIRQEFQDFIDIVNLKILELDKNVGEITSDTVKEAIKNGEISLSLDYNEESESLSLNVYGGE